MSNESTTPSPAVVVVAAATPTPPATLTAPATSENATKVMVPAYVNDGRFSLARAMANLPTDLQNVAVGGEAIPDYLADKDGLDMLADMVRPARLKVVQSLSASLKEIGFSDGDIVLTPLMQKVGNMSSPLDAVCLMSWSEYLALNPRGIPGDYIKERSTDAKSKLAVRARNRDREPHESGGKDRNGNPLMVEYVKASNFILYLLDHGIAAVVTFMKGEARYGDAFASLIMARGMATYGGVYSVRCCMHQNTAGDKWPGFTITNSSRYGGRIPQELVASMKEMHHYYRTAWASQNLDVNYEEAEPEPNPAEPSEY